MPARDSLFESVRIFKEITDQPFMVDNGLGQNDHNKRAQVLRSGLAVGLFNALEQFLKDRFGELMQELSGAAVSYSEFPEPLKHLLSVRAVNGLHGYLGRTERAERLSVFHSQIGQVAGMNLSPPAFSCLGFGYERSNLKEQDLTETMRAFGVSKCWEAMQDIAARAGLSRPSLKADFQFLGTMRNRAAHNPGTNIATSDLDIAADVVPAVALGFDLIASTVVRAYCKLPSMARIEEAVRTPAVKLRFLDQAAGAVWRERGEASARYLKVHPNLLAAKAMTLSRSRPRGETIIIRSARMLPREWLG